MRNLHTYQFFPKSQVPDYRYPAPDVLLYLPWVHIPHRVFAFEALIGSIFVTAAILFTRALVRRGTAAREAGTFSGVALLCSYPVWFEWRQTNVEVVVFLLLAIAIYAYVKQRFSLAAILIGFAGALKIAPLIFIVIFLLRRQYRAAAIASLAAVALTLPCLMLLTPSFVYSVQGVARGLGAYNLIVVQTLLPQGIGYDHSLFAIVKYVEFAITGSLQSIAFVQRAYLATVLVSGMLVLWQRVRFLPLINQITLLTLAMTFFAPSAFDYTLLHLYIPLAMLSLFAVKQKGRAAGFLTVLVCFALLTSPESFLIFRGRLFAGQFRAVVCLALVYLCVHHPFASEFDGYEQTVASA